MFANCLLMWQNAIDEKTYDPKPYLVDTGMFIKSCKWNPNGNVFAVCGSVSENGTEPKGCI